MCICNDRRWPETYRVMGLQSVELVLLGYNTPTHVPWMPVYDHLTYFHNHLCMQSGAYQNSTWVVGIAKAGNERAANFSPAAASSRPRERSSHWRAPRLTRCLPPSATSTSAATTKKPCSTSRNTGA